MAKIFRSDAQGEYHDGTDGLANSFRYYIDFFHVPTAESVQFKAFLTSFDDSFESDWNTEDVYGRMDPIQTFKGTKRNISIEWEVVAGSVEEAKLNLEKCTTLFGMLYPVYSAQGSGKNLVVSSPPLFKVRFINLIQDAGAGAPVAGSAANSGIVCSIAGFNYSPDIDAGFMHVGASEVYPQTIKLTADMTVMHTHGLGYDQNGARRQANFPYGSSTEGGGQSSQSTGTSTQPRAVTDSAAQRMNNGSE